MSIFHSSTIWKIYYPHDTNTVLYEHIKSEGVLTTWKVPLQAGLLKDRQYRFECVHVANTGSMSEPGITYYTPTREVTYEPTITIEPEQSSPYSLLTLNVKLTDIELYQFESIVEEVEVVFTPVDTTDSFTIKRNVSLDIHHFGDGVLVEMNTSERLIPNTVYKVKARYRDSIFGWGQYGVEETLITGGFIKEQLSFDSYVKPDNVSMVVRVNSLGLNRPAAFTPNFDELVVRNIKDQDGTYEEIVITEGDLNLLPNVFTCTLSTPLEGAVDYSTILRVNEKNHYGLSDSSQVGITRKTIGLSVPVITSPVANAVNIPYNTTIACNNLTTVPSNWVTLNSIEWQLATSSLFTTESIVDSATLTANATSWSVTSLLPNTNFFVRARYKGTGLCGQEFVSDWNVSHRFTTIQATIQKPIITSPANNAEGIQETIVTNSNIMIVTPNGWFTHISSDWQLSRRSDFANLDVERLNETGAGRLQQTFNELLPNQIYNLRVRYRGEDMYGAVVISEWSNRVSFSTREPHILAPNILFPANNATNVDWQPELTSSVFESSPAGSMTHGATEWELAVDASFNQIIDTIIIADIENLYKWRPPLLPAGTKLYARVRYSSDRILQPAITSPTPNTTNVDFHHAFRGGTFVSDPPGKVHVSSDWEVASDADFTDIVIVGYGMTGNARTQWVPDTPLPQTSNLWVRVRYHGQ